MRNTTISRIREKDLNKVITWKSNQRLSDQIMARKKHLNLNEAKMWLKTNERDKNHVIKGIYQEEFNKLFFVGIVRLMFIDFKAKTTELGIYIGEEDYHNKGVGSNALRLIINHAFQNLNLNKIYLKVANTNEKAIKLYLNNNFKIEGILSEHYFNLTTNAYEDIYHMSLFKKSYII